MDQEKHVDASGAPIEVNDAEKSHLVVDLRKISLATILSGFVNFTLICISLNVESSFLRKFVLPGAQSVLLKTETVAQVVAVLTAISKFQIGRFNFISQGSSTNVARALIVAIVLTFINGSLDMNVSYVVSEAMWGPPMTPVEA